MAIKVSVKQNLLTLAIAIIACQSNATTLENTVRINKYEVLDSRRKDKKMWDTMQDLCRPRLIFYYSSFDFASDEIFNLQSV